MQRDQQALVGAVNGVGDFAPYGIERRRISLAQIPRQE